MRRPSRLRWIPFGILALAMVWFGLVRVAGVNPSLPIDVVLAAGAVEHFDGLEAEPGDFVVLLHGLSRSGASMGRLERSLSAHRYRVWSPSYPSARHTIDDHAAWLQGELEERLQREEGKVRLSFVGHSMGGLVARAYLRRPGARPAQRLVCIGTPHGGSLRAEKLARNRLMRRLVGAAALPDLVPGSPFLLGLGPAAAGTGNIAGGLGDGQGYGRGLPGDDDGTVRVEETRQPGEAGFVLVPVRHTFLPAEPEVLHQVLVFLKNGRFD